MANILLFALPILLTFSAYTAKPEPVKCQDKN
jgi:hypothetical protein